MRSSKMNLDVGNFQMFLQMPDLRNVEFLLSKHSDDLKKNPKFSTSGCWCGRFCISTFGRFLEILQENIPKLLEDNCDF